MTPEPTNLVLQPRDVHFDYSDLPMHWVPDEPFATHVINVLHLLLPAGERWFVNVLTQALPLIKDDALLCDVRGFIGQEAIHAREHDVVLDHLRARGLDASPYTTQLEWGFQKLLGDRDLTGAEAEEWLVERVGIIAAVEHLTAFLGQWILNAKDLDARGADPMMMDLLRWHGSEEVEHRSVAFDLLTHLDPRYSRRVRTAAFAFPVLFWFWVRGVKFLMRHDPTLPANAKPRWRDLLRAKRKGLTPGYADVARFGSTYLARAYHPSRHGSTAQAVAYLSSSPAARAAAR